VDKWGYGSQDDITVVCDGWGILHGEKAMSNIKPERCDDEVVVYVGDYEVNHGSMRWLGRITRRIFNEQNCGIK